MAATEKPGEILPSKILSSSSIASFSSSSSSSGDDQIEASSLTHEVYLLFYLQRVSRYVASLGFMGVVLTILEIEISYQYYARSYSVACTVLKGITSATTFLCILALLQYHLILFHLLKNRNIIPETEPFYRGAHFGRFLMELAIVIWHIPPGLDFHRSTAFIPDEAGVITFLRIYLIIYAVRDHSKLTSSGGLLLGALADIKVSAAFVSKSLLQARPISWLLFVYVFMVLSLSYLLLIFERLDSASNIARLGDALWNILITMFTLGYGDTVPITDLGRLVSVVAAIVGVFFNALLFAVVFEQIQPSSVESRVITFFAQEEFKNTLSNHAALVIQQTWKFSLAYRLDKASSLAIRRWRILRSSIKMWRALRRQQRRTKEIPFPVRLEVLLTQTKSLKEDRLSIEQRLETILNHLELARSVNSGPRLEQSDLQQRIELLLAHVSSMMEATDRLDDKYANLIAHGDSLDSRIRQLIAQFDTSAKSSDQPTATPLKSADISASNTHSSSVSPKQSKNAKTRRRKKK